MNKFLTISAYTTLLLGAFLITGCSSSDDGGTTTTATEITAENMEALATAGTEGVKQAVSTNNVPLSFAKVGKASPVQSLTVSLAQTVSQDPKFLVENLSTEICVGGGSAIADGDESNFTIIFTNCTITGGIVMDGTVNITTSVSGSTTTISLNYINFTVTFDGETETFDLKVTCTSTDNSDGTFTTSCTFDSEALGIDGRTYSVTDISVSGDSISGYTVSATITDPDHGIITITTTTPIRFGSCSNGQPDSGVIVVSDGTNTMTVTYIDCNSFSIDFDGSTTTFFW